MLSYFLFPGVLVMGYRILLPGQELVLHGLFCPVFSFLVILCLGRFYFSFLFCLWYNLSSSVPFFPLFSVGPSNPLISDTEGL